MFFCIVFFLGGEVGDSSMDLHVVDVLQVKLLLILVVVVKLLDRRAHLALGQESRDVLV